MVTISDIASLKYFNTMLLAVICEGDPPKLEHSRLNWSKYDTYYKSEAEYTCITGYTFTQHIQSQRLTCKEDRVWTPKNPNVFNKGCLSK